LFEQDEAAQGWEFGIGPKQDQGFDEFPVARSHCDADIIGIGRVAIGFSFALISVDVNIKEPADVLRFIERDGLH